MSVSGGDVTFRLLGDASGALASVNSVGSALNAVAEIATGLVIGEAFVASVDGAIDAVHELFSSMMDVNSAIEQFNTQMGVLFDNASTSMNNTGQASDAAASRTSSAGYTIARAQQSMADAAQDHARAIAQINDEAQKARDTLTATLQELAQAYEQSMSDLTASHDAAMDKLKQGEADATQQFNEQLAQRTQAFNDAMQSLQDSHQKTMQSLADQLEQLTETYQQEQEKRDATFLAQDQSAPDTYEAQRKKALADAKSLQSDLADARAAGDSDLVAALENRIQQEQALAGENYDSYLANLHAQQAATQAAADQAYQLKVQKIQQEQATEEASYADRVKKLQDSYNAEVASLRESLAKKLAETNQQMASEQSAYEKQVAVKQATYDKDVANAKKAEQDKLAALQQRFDQENLMYERHIRDLNEQIDHAGAGGGGKPSAAAKRMAGPEVNELPDEKKALEDYTGQKLKNGQEYAEALNEFLMQATFGTPFTADDLRKASRTLTGFKLDTTKWLDTIVNTAAATGQTPQMIASLLGRISTGEGGRAAYEFAQLGVPLQDILPKGSFDSANALTLPASQALPLIMSGLQSRFKGMAASQAQTLPGLLSNFADLGLIVQGIIGGVPMSPPAPRRGDEGRNQEGAAQPKGLYTDIEDELRKIYEWASKNQDKIAEVAATIRDKLHQAFTDLAPVIERIAGQIEQWFASGQAEKDFASLGDTIRTVSSHATDLYNDLESVINTVKDGLDTWNKFKDIAGALLVTFIGWQILTTIGEAFVTIGGIIEGLSVIFTGLGVAEGLALLPLSPILIIVGLIAGAVALLYLAWTNNWFGIRDTITNVWNSMSSTIARVWNGVITWVGDTLDWLERKFQDAWQNIRDGIVNAIVQAAVAIAGTINSILSTVEQLVNKVINGIAKILGPMVNFINQGLRALGLPTIDSPILNPVSLGQIDIASLESSLQAALPNLVSYAMAALLGPVGGAALTVPGVIPAPPSNLSGTVPDGQTGSVNYDQLGAAVATALQNNPPNIYVDGQNLTSYVQQSLLRYGSRNGSILGSNA
jgi:hypothetical protein